MSLFVQGRKKTFQILTQRLSAKDNVIWVHTASLGEFEQGLPLIERLKAAYPSSTLVITFFSPSGYEVKKSNTVADATVYLPMDSKGNVRRFLEVVQPKLVIFIKYEIWPNYMRELRKKHIPTLLVSGIFREKQVYFKWYGSFMRRALQSFSHFFLQDEASKKLLASIGFTNTSVSGDTRFDRVAKILQRDNALGFMEEFTAQSSCLVSGSTWPEDEAILTDFINTDKTGLKFVIAPHTIQKSHNLSLKKSIRKRCVLFSEMEKYDISNVDVLIVDTIGILTKIYSYADIAYVGGGFATGLHNSLEPAVFGIPVLIGPNYEGFKEAEDMVRLGGCISVKDKKEFKEAMYQLLSNQEYRQQIGEINSNYTHTNIGATEAVLHYVHSILQ